MELDLFEMYTVSDRETRLTGGVFVQTLNRNGDGVTYIRVDETDIVNETLSTKTGELP